jgi:hypothetical protein
MDIQRINELCYKNKLTRSAQMKFKTASLLGLIFPLSGALLISAFLGCGGGGAYGSGKNPYDGTWFVNLKGYTLPTAAAGGGTVSCTELPLYIVVSHGSGTGTETIQCTNAASTNYYMDMGVTLTPAASGIGGTVALETTGGGSFAATGACIDRNTCSAPGLIMIRCGQAASGC